jgi:hypothetical protein
MLKAGALFVSVTISFIIAVLISSLILLSFHYKIQNRENLLQKKMDRNARSALTWLMVSDTDMKENTLMDLYGEESDSVMLRKASWGAYDVATVKSVSGKYSLTKTVLYGYKPDETLSGALYLTDLSRPLNLCGKTSITGTCYLPEAGVKRGYIEGKSYEGKELIKGATKLSKNSLPPLEKQIIKRLSGFVSDQPFAQHVYKEIQLTSDSLIQSFMDTTVLIRMNGSLSGNYYSGNILVYSDKTIEVEAGTFLEDVILVARSIRIKKGFKGVVQAFAVDSIIVEEEVKLNYPSALGLFKKDYKTSQPFIKVMKKSVVSGMIFTSQSEFVNDLKQTLISIDKEAIVKGQVYSDGFIDLKGEVLGMVWCNKVLLKTASSIYENHLLDAIIDPTKLSLHYAGSGLIAAGKRKKIIKWLE